jgi:hypothetical protein
MWDIACLGQSLSTFFHTEGGSLFVFMGQAST